MFIHNRLLIEMNNAIRLSKSELPQEKQMAVIIFDHMIEIVLFNAVKAAFEWPTGKRLNVPLDSKTRKAALQKYDSVIKFAKKLGFLTEQDEHLLHFTHAIRNEIYHKGKTELDNTILALTIYFYFVAHNKPILTKTNGLTSIGSEPGYEPIDFGQGLPDDPFERYINSQEYVSKAFDYLVSTMPKLGRFRDLASEYCITVIEEIEQNIEYIKTSMKWMNFYAALATSNISETAPVFTEYATKNRKPKNIDSILLSSEFLRLHEDALDDLDTKSGRFRHSKRMLGFYKRGKKQTYPHWVNMERLKARTEKLKKERIEVAIQNFGSINEALEKLHLDSSFAAIMFSGYEMELYDRYRGK
jgi:hypothetical protein